MYYYLHIHAPLTYISNKRVRAQHCSPLFLKIVRESTRRHYSEMNEKQ